MRDKASTSPARLFDRPAANISNAVQQPEEVDDTATFDLTTNETFTPPPAANAAVNDAPEQVGGAVDRAVDFNENSTTKKSTAPPRSLDS
ncbi:MAG: hypothetical protein ACREOZ_03535 [Gloeomargaritales cyanobacterium]